MPFSLKYGSITLPISVSARQQAQRFAAEQSNPTKAQQVYHNTLAVELVDLYLKMMDIPTQIDRSHSWRSIDRLATNVADLYLPNIGHLECRPVELGQATCEVPPEVWWNRVGYVVVGLELGAQQGTLLGFAQQVNQPSLPLSQLAPIEALLTCLEPLLQSNQASAAPLPIPLSQWWRDRTIAGWHWCEQHILHRSLPILITMRDRLPNLDPQVSQSLQTALLQRCFQVGTMPQPQFSYRSHPSPSQPTPLPFEIDPSSTQTLVRILKTTEDETIRWTAAEMLWTIDPSHPETIGRRVLDLGMLILGHPVALMVATLQKTNGTIAVLLRVYPMGDQPYLPSGLQLRGRDADGNPFSVAQARQQDNYIQLYFLAEVGEQFSVQVELNEAIAVEHFTV